MVGLSVFTVLTGSYLLLLYRRGLYLRYLEATAGPALTSTKRKVIGESEILIRTLPELSQAMEKALGKRAVAVSVWRTSAAS